MWMNRQAGHAGGGACMIGVWECVNAGGHAGRDDVWEVRGAVQLGQMALETDGTH